MKTKAKQVMLAACLCVAGGVWAADCGDYRVIRIDDAPFEMPELQEYVFPDRTFDVADYGAKPDGTLATEPIARAVEACAAAGGGRVNVGPGTYLTGPVHLRSGVELHLEKGAKLLFSDDPKLYLPAVPSSWEGLECLNYSPLIYAYGCTNVALTGKGCIEAKMDFWKEQMNEKKTGIQEARRILYTWGSEDYPVEKRDITKAHPAIMRPQLVQFNRCRNVRVEGIEVHDSPFWTMHMFLCDGVIVRGIDSKAHGFNNDGIDLEMTRNVLVEDSSFSQGDDGFVFKAGRNRDAWRIGRATENVVIRNCDVKKAGSLVGVGSELSGGIRNVYVHDCTVGQVARLYYIKTNHRRGGVVDNIWLRNVKAGAMLKVAAVETDVLYQWRNFRDYETRLTKISNLHLENVEVDASVVGIDLVGDRREPIDGFTAKNVRIGRTERFLTHVENAKNVDFQDVTGGETGPVHTPWNPVFTLPAEDTEILIDPQAPKATRLAAEEMSALLGRIFGRKVPIVTQPGYGKRSVVLGTNAWSVAAGLAPEKLPRDSFQMKIKNWKLYIAGCDSTDADPEANNYLGDECLWQPQFERGTLFGVYAFLERYAGARFYFPGELGTILPKAKEIVVESCDVSSTPSFSVRRYGYADGPVPEEALEGLTEREFKRLNFYRLRGETAYIPCCHGQNKLFLGQRFGETHPEYLRLCENGKRAPVAAKWQERPRCAFGQLCQSSGIWEEIYRDAKSYFSGEDASVRGIHAADGGGDGFAWGRNASGRLYMDVMPHDGCGQCSCADCQAAYAAAKDRTNYATELVWGKVAELARRIRADGLKGRFTMMAYHPYGAVPDFELPDNIDVMVAGSGPWTFRAKELLAQNVARIRAWERKLGHKVWLWNYIDKVSCGGTDIPDAPCVSPKAVGLYYQHVADWIFGAFAESESDRWIYNYLNYYVFSRVAWDRYVDVEAVLDEHHRLMFGAGAADMKRFFELLEDLWVGGVAGKSKDSPVGPVLVRPDPRTLWTEIYSPANLATLKACLDGAARAVKPDSLEARRIALFRRHIYEPLVKWPEKYAAESSVPAELKRREGRPDRSIVRNGDFTSLDGWTEEGGRFGSISLSKIEFVSAPSSLCFETTTPPEEGRSLYLYATQASAKLKEPLKPGTKYRVSFFVKCEDLRPIIKNGGFYVQWWDSSWNWAPRKSLPLTGTTDWTHCCYEVRTRPAFNEEHDHAVQLFVTGALGKVYVDDLRFEEVEDEVALTPQNAEVVIAKDACAVVRFAADEATNFLSRAFGTAVPVVNEPTEGRVSLILGENAWSKAAGIDPSARPRDTFFIRAEGNRVHIVGTDDAKANPRRSSPIGYERATLLGLYTFLEDRAGCRFYFPGELGEVVPRTDRIAVPAGTAESTPSFPIRKYYFGDGRWYEDLDAKETRRMKNLSWLRVRASTDTIPCCHGTAYMKLVERYAKTHPEYFARRSDGSRCHNFTGSKSSRNGYLCFSSDVRDVIVGECERKFRAGQRYADIMPNDALAECHCEKCQAAYRKDLPCYMTEVIWDYTRYVANRLIEKGVPGIVTQMAYAQYRRIPDFDLPTNVYVMVAETGPWSMANPQKLRKEQDEIRAWGRKIRNPVYIWTYPHKYGALNIPGIPDIAPKAWGEYYKALAGDIVGTFAESETDKWIYHYLNYYVFARVMWDAKTDVDAVIDEHHRLMFGAGAAPMKEFYEILERKWVREVAGNIKETNVGPVAAPPTEVEMWTKVYGPDTVAKLDALLTRAAAAVAPGSLEARRIAFFRHEYFDALVDGTKTYAEKRAAIDALVWRAKDGRPIELVPFKVKKGREPEEFVKTRVTAARTATDLVVTFDAEDNRMDDIAAPAREQDHRDTWRDTSVEIVLNPTADLKTYYHVIVNLAGSVADSRCTLAGMKIASSDAAWDAKAKVEIAKRADGWRMEVAIPLETLGPMKDVFPAEFARNRNTKSGKGTCLYHWSPYAFGFNSLSELGKIDLR